MNILAMIKVRGLLFETRTHIKSECSQRGPLKLAVCGVLYSRHRVAVVTAVYQNCFPSYLRHLHLPNHRAVNASSNLRTTKWVLMISSSRMASTTGAPSKWKLNSLATISLGRNTSCPMTSSIASWISHVTKNWLTLHRSLNKLIGDMLENTVPKYWNW